MTMPKTKPKVILDLPTIQKMCEQYVEQDISMQVIADLYCISRNRVRKVFDNAIIFEYVDLPMAQAMKRTAQRHYLKRCYELNVIPSDKVLLHYDELIQAAKQRKETIARLNFIRFTLEIYDETFTPDDYPYTKEELRKQLVECKSILKKLEGMA